MSLEGAPVRPGGISPTRPGAAGPEALAATHAAPSAVPGDARRVQRPGPPRAERSSLRGAGRGSSRGPGGVASVSPPGRGGRGAALAHGMAWTRPGAPLHIPLALAVRGAVEKRVHARATRERESVERANP